MSDVIGNNSGMCDFIGNLPPGVSSGANDKTVFFNAEYSANSDNQRIRPLGSTGAWRFNFYVPIDFSLLISLEAKGIPRADFTDKSIWLDSNYYGSSELKTNHVDSDHTKIFSGVLNTDIGIDLSSVFPNLGAQDQCGILIDHKTIGTYIDYRGILLVYR